MKDISIFLTKKYTFIPVMLVFITAPLHGWTLLYVAGIPIARLDLIAVLVALGVATMVVVVCGQVRIVKINLLMIALFGVATLSSLYAVVRSTTPTAPITTMLPQVAILILLLFTIPILVRTMTGLTAVVRAWILSAVVVSGFAVYQGIARALSLPLAVLVFNVPSPGTMQRIGYTNSFGPFFRVASVFAEPSWLGAYLVPPAIFCLLLLVNRSDGAVFQNKRKTVATGVIIIIGIVLSASLLAYLTLLAVLLIFVIPIGVSIGRLRLRYAPAIVLLAIPPAILSSSFRAGIERIITLVRQLVLSVFSGGMAFSVGSAHVRFRMMQATVETWTSGTTAQLFIGHGLNTLERSPGVGYTAATSSYFQLLLDTGIIGVTLFIGVIIGIGVTTYRLSFASDRDSASQMLGIAFTGVVIATSIQFFLMGFVRPVRWLGILGALCYISTIGSAEDLT